MRTLKSSLKLLSMQISNKENALICIINATFQRITSADDGLCCFLECIVSSKKQFDSVEAMIVQKMENGALWHQSSVFNVNLLIKHCLQVNSTVIYDNIRISTLSIRYQMGKNTTNFHRTFPFNSHSLESMALCATSHGSLASVLQTK